MNRVTLLITRSASCLLPTIMISASEREIRAEGSVLDVQDMTERVKLLTGQDKA